MDRLERQIEQELGRLTPTGSPDMAAIVRAWPAAVGDEIARRAWPARVARDGTLHVNAVDSIWAFQLGTLAATILEQLREHIGEATPQALRFAPGPVPEPAADPASEGLSRPPAPTEQEAAAGASLAASIDDSELRETVARAAAASLARGRFKARSDRPF
jgi:hypothetical protein